MTGYASWVRRRAVIVALVALAWALGAAAVLLIVPMGPSLSVDSSGRSTRSSRTLLETEGTEIIVVLAVPIALTVASLVGAVAHRAWLTAAAASLLMIGVLLGAASIGLIFLPSAVAVMLATRWTATGGEYSARQERR